MLFLVPHLIGTFKSRKALFFSPSFLFRWTESDGVKGTLMKIFCCSPWESAGCGNICQSLLFWGELGLVQIGETGTALAVALLAYLQCSSLVGTGSIVPKSGLGPEKSCVHRQPIPICKELTVERG